MKKSASMVMSTILALSVFSGISSYPRNVEAAVAPQFTVDLSNQYRTATHVASGSLYGLAEDGRPTDALIGPTKPKMFTQMAPNGGQLPNGETSPIGDALVLAPVAARNGASVMIRMPDIYPDFPYKWVSWADWYSKVDTMVNARIASGATNIYGYELWNEPNWTWDTAKAGAFNDGWKNTYLRVKTLDTTTKIVGPSIDKYDATWMSNFLTYAKNNNVLPDIISWHELGNPEGNNVDNPKPWTIKDHIATYRALEASLGISPRPISINEYSVIQEEAVPGSNVRYFAQFERNNVDTATAAFWFRPGRLSNLITDTAKANGGWWLFKWYGDMTGNMAMTTPSVTNALGLDGIASIDSTKQEAHVLFGGADGDSNIVVQGFGSASFFTNNAHVKVETTPWYGVDTAVSTPTPVFEGDFAIANGQISVPITGMNKSSGYNMVITPAAGTNNNRYEAENTTINHSTNYSNISASNGKYIGSMDFSDSYVQYTVNAATAGTYKMDIRYANGTAASSTHNLSINGGAAGAVTYPVTGGWLSSGNSGTVTVSVNLNAGSNTIRLSKGATGYAELDYVQLAKPAPFNLRVEAEKATVNHSVISTGDYASNNWFVGNIDYSDSYVEYNVNVPSTGTYSMEIGYANGTSANSTHSLSVNGGASTTVTYPTTGGWTKVYFPNNGTRKVMTQNVNLIAGSNTIRFTKATSYAELDYIQLQLNNTYEAESATVNHSLTFSNLNISNGSYVGNIDFSDSYVQFTVNVTTAGTYNMDIGYANGGTATSTHNLSINGGASSTVNYPVTGGWLSSGNGINLGVKTVTVNLNAGNNTIRLTKGATGNAELDRVTVY